jgi:UDP:flavonoid glycosyltransferase YjiC (YdhE family)
VRIFFAAAPAYGLMLPIIPLVWAARAAGHEVLLATTSEMCEVGAQSGLPVVDVFPDRRRWLELMAMIGKPDAVPSGLPEEIRMASRARHPFGMFTATMTEPTIAAAGAFDPELVVYTSDHRAGGLTAASLGVPGLEVGNRISWSARDAGWGDRGGGFGGDELVEALCRRLAIRDADPAPIARIDPRPPSMGGLTVDEPDAVDAVPWWPMRYVPYNGGAVLPDWAMRAPARPRIGVTLGTVVPLIAGTSSLSVVVEALGECDVEVILAAGRADLSGLGTLPENVRSVGYLALSAFLPHCSLLVHHGGSGTTAAPLFYGVPQLVLPSFADGPLSAQRVVDRGVGLSHDPGAIDVEAVRRLVDRLLTEPSFGLAAAEVCREIAGQPSPAEVMARATASVLTTSDATSGRR